MVQDIEKVMSTIYEGERVAAIISLKVDTKEVDRVATQIAEFDAIQDLFLVTGDTDLVAKARFVDYKKLKDFVVSSLAPIPGVKDTKTLMVVTTYKEGGVSK